MAARIIGRTWRRRVLVASGAVVGGAGVASSKAGTSSDENVKITPAEQQFYTSYGYELKGKQLIKPPEGWNGRLFKIRVDYPKSAAVAAEEGLSPIPGPDQGIPSATDAPWLSIDFRKNPKEYCKVIREYCYEGNLNPGNEFVLQANKFRDWYHAPWMHWNPNGREPLNGLTFERPTPPNEFAAKQSSWIQTWACGFYNRAGASTFQKIWNSPGEPNWTKDHAQFPLGTCVFKVLMTDATKEEIFAVDGAPEMQAVITKRGNKNAAERNTSPSKVRLLQMDFAVRDDRAEIGWVFGTFMFDGSQRDKNPWHRTIPVGIMWGNDPNLTPADIAAAKKPQESWINKEAEDLRVALGGKRPSWGWNGNTPGPGRANGPADNFVSACASCHSVATKEGPPELIPPDKNPETKQPTTDEERMFWFRNIPSGQPFRPGKTSADYSLQMMVGFANYEKWKMDQSLISRTLMRVPFTPQSRQAEALDQKRLPLRGLDQLD